MAIVSTSVPTAQEVTNLLNVLVQIVTDVKAKKNVAEVVTDAVPDLVTALGGLAGLSSEFANKAAVANSVYLSVESIVEALVA